MRTQRFMDAYDRGLTGARAAYAAKKYKGHRMPPTEEMLKRMDEDGVPKY
jgi:hypothetical protein